MPTPATHIKDNHKEFLKFLKVRFPLYHLSNVFYRDLHYGVMAYLDLNRMTKGYTESESVTKEVVSFLEGEGILKPIDDKTWLLQYPDFKMQPKKKPAPAKPAPAAKAAAPAAKPAAPAGAAKPAPAAPAPATPAPAADAKPDPAPKTDAAPKPDTAPPAS